MKKPIISIIVIFLVLSVASCKNSKNPYVEKDDENTDIDYITNDDGDTGNSGDDTGDTGNTGDADEDIDEYPDDEEDGDEYPEEDCDENDEYPDEEGPDDENHFPPDEARSTILWGSPYNDYGFSVAVCEISGSIYVGGQKEGKKGFLTKFSLSGVKKWTEYWNTDGDDAVYGLTLDDSGNIYVTGYTGGSLDGNTNAGGWDVFLSKVDSSGVKQWTKQWGAEKDDMGGSLITDNTNIYVTGYLNFDMDFEAGMIKSDIFLSKFNSNGVEQWTEQLSSGGFDSSESIAMDNEGNVYITGVTDGDLDGNTLTGIWDIFLSKFDNDGTKQWTKQWGALNHAQGGNSLIIDNDGSIYMGGFAAFSEAEYETTYDILISKLSDDGTELWTDIWGSDENDAGSFIVLDSNSNIFMCGCIGGDIEDHISESECDIFLTKYLNNGTKQWTKIYGSTGFDSCYSITIDSYDNIFMTGYTGGDLDGNINAGRTDIFLTKWNVWDLL